MGSTQGSASGTFSQLIEPDGVDDFGLTYADLNAYQKEKLEDAYNMSIDGPTPTTTRLPKTSCSTAAYEPIIVTITHILNERASIGWTSYSIPAYRCRFSPSDLRPNALPVFMTTPTSPNRWPGPWASGSRCRL
jgi:hypothetical protein